ncbi:low temperature requirement protein A [Salmonella enterica]|nr:low temperature requirement protein A [Salmonella enterica]
MSNFQKLINMLKAADCTLTKSLDGADGYPLSKQSLDAALKSCGELGYGPKTQQLLKDMHAAGCKAGLSDKALEDHIAQSMRELATKPMTKSTTPGEALAAVMDGASVPVFDPNQQIRDASVEAVHRARAQQISDAQFLQEVADRGVPFAEVNQLHQVMEQTRGLPDDVRAPAMQAVRAALPQERVSPAVQGIDWDAVGWAGQPAKR